MIFPHDRLSLCTVQNEWYSQRVQSFFRQELDHDGEDITTNSIGEWANKTVHATLTAKSSGILAGQEEAEYLIHTFFPNVFGIWHIKDGEILQKGDCFCTLTGNAPELLRLERPIINLLMRMSGIATHTNRLQKMCTLPLCATRKTCWGPLDKKAVGIGGGLTHRLGLFDAVLLKENHIALLSSLQEIQNVIHKKPFPSFFEVEVETESEFLEVYSVFCKADTMLPKVIMFDNFLPPEIERIQRNISQTERVQQNIFLEASGGITEKTMNEYEQCGVDVLSLSSLTLCAGTVDISLRIQK